MPPTPRLVLDADVARRNISMAQARADAAGTHLRPHVKTHKSPAIARWQLEAGAVGITVATADEAEVFADAGFDDIFIAFPLWVDDALATRLHVLAERTRLLLAAESVEGAQQLARHRIRAEVLVEVDTGHHRTGAEPSRAGDVADAIAADDGRAVGVFSFPGHSYAPGMRAHAAQQEATALAAAADSLRHHGHDVTVISGGSSPSLADADLSVLTETRPGVYAVNDAQQWELGACTADDVALWCDATVVSRRDGPNARVVVNAGSKILAADRPSWASGHGRVLDVPDARVVALSEHHATIEWPASPPPLGTTVRVVPNHACNAINLVTEIHQVSGPTLPVAARGCCQ